MRYSLIIIATILFANASLQATFNFSSKNSTLNLTTANSSLTLNSPITGYNGTLKIDVESSTSIQGSAANTIVFANGVVASGYNSFVLTGTYQGSVGEVIAMGAGDSLEVAAGSVLQSVTVAGTVGSPSLIRGSPVFTSPIVLQSSSAALTLAIDNKLTQNITLAGGLVTLGNDLSLADGVFLSGNGTVDLQNFSLRMSETSATPWTGSLTFKNARDIQLNGYTTLNGTWTFGDVGGVSDLNGNGNILDMSGGGTIVVAANHTLYLTDVHVKGLGSGLGDFSLNVTNGTIKLSNVTLELGAEYAHTSGQIYVQGDKCRVISGNTSGGNNTFDLSSTATLTVDHGVLIYETLLGQNVSPFTYTNMGNQQNLINGGCIRGAVTSGSSVNIVFDEAAGTSFLNQNYDLTSQTLLVFTNSAGGTQSTALNGNGYSIQLPYGVSNYIQVAAGLTVTLQDVVLQDFTTSSVSYGAGAALNFGDNSILSLNADANFTNSTVPWNFVGNGKIEANGQTITLGASNAITVTGAKTLTIKNANLNITNATGLSCLTNSATISFVNCNITVEDSGYTFATGNITVNGNVFIRGCDQLIPSLKPAFTFSTSGALTVLTTAVLSLTGDLNFVYQPNPTTNSDTLAQSKRHVTMQDPSAKIVFDGCTVTSTATGMALDHGKLQITDKVQLTVSTSPGAAFEIGSALEVTLRAGALLEVDGPMMYTVTTYP